MINFDCFTLNNFLNQNVEFLIGARIQKIQQPTRQELIFILRNNSVTKKFYININPKFFHICFLSKENEEKRYLKIPQSPPMFCMLLRKYLENSKISKVLQPEGERILEFYIKTYDETNEEIYLCLAIELMGKHSNVILYNYDTNVIIGCAHNIGEDKSKVRELYGGIPYMYPPKNIVKSFTGLSDVLNKNSDINEQIDLHFAQLQEKEIFKNLETNLFSLTRNNLKKINSSIEKIQKQTKSKEKIDLYRQKGDLIMANLFDNKDYLPFIEVFNYQTNSPLKIELDSTKTLKENANKYFKLYTKGKTAIQKMDEMLKNLLLEKEYLEQIYYSVETAEKLEVLLEIEDEILTINGKSNKKNNDKIRKKSSKEISNIKTIKKPPYTIYIGRNNKQNDYIVSKLSRKEDLWFHIHNCAGSHVLLRAEAGVTYTQDIILECAQLAKTYSSAKNSSKVGIIYTLAKNLKKPSGANLGYVTYKGEKEIII